VADSLLDLALASGECDEALWSRLIGETPGNFFFNEYHTFHYTVPTEAESTHFYELYRATIDIHIVKNFSRYASLLLSNCSLSARVLHILTQVTETAVGEPSLEAYRTSFVSQLTEGFVRHSAIWQVLICCVHIFSSSSHVQPTQPSKVKTVSLSLLKNLMRLDGSFIGSRERNSSFPILFGFYTHLLKDGFMSLSLKLNALPLLSDWFSVSESDEPVLRSSLERFMALHFPLYSLEYPETSPRRNEYLHAVELLFAALTKSESLMLLDVLILMYCKGPFC
jgi:hypothetical protein